MKKGIKYSICKRRRALFGEDIRKWREYWYSKGSPKKEWDVNKWKLGHFKKEFRDEFRIENKKALTAVFRDKETALKLINEFFGYEENKSWT